MHRERECWFGGRADIVVQSIWGPMVENGTRVMVGGRRVENSTEKCVEGELM